MTSPASSAAATSASSMADPVAEVLGMFCDVWPQRPAGLFMRTETDDDVGFIRDLYATTRAEELVRVDWDAQAKQAFVDQQFHAQRSQYRQHYSDAAFLVIERDGERIGRLYLHRTRSELRLMEITLLPACRGHGLGTALMQRVLQWGDALVVPVSLHVEPFNRAHALYRRLGFETREERGVYHFMRREAAKAGAHQAKCQIPAKKGAAPDPACED